MIRKIANSIWVAEQPLQFMGLEIGARATIIDISGEGDLLVHSPIRPSAELTGELNHLGKVKYVVAPNLFHHLYVADFMKNYGQAQLFSAPGLGQKRPDLHIDEVIEENKKYPWSAVAQHHVVQGIPLSNEVVFYLPAQKTLLVTDLGLHICADSPLLTRLVFKAMGMLDRFGWSGVEKSLFIRNKKLFAASSKKILSWDFDKIILSHGHLIREEGHKHFKNAFQNKAHS